MKTDKPFKIRGYDSFSSEWFPVGEYETYDEAVDVANARGGTMTLMYVYDKDGKQVYRAGTF